MTFDPSVVYLRYSALKLHFTTEKYDCFKYNFKTKNTTLSYYKTNGKQFYSKLARQFAKIEDIDNYLVSNFVEGKKFIGDMVEDDAVYKAWQKRNQSLGRVFSLDVEELHRHTPVFDDLFKVVDGQYPPIIVLLNNNVISIESVVIINQLTNFVNNVDKEITDPLFWPDLKLRLNKYNPFVRVDLNRFRQMVVDQYNQ